VPAEPGLATPPSEFVPPLPPKPGAPVVHPLDRSGRPVPVDWISEPAVGFLRDLLAWLFALLTLVFFVGTSIAHTVVEKSWPAQQRGLIPTEGTEVLTELDRKMMAFEPTTDGQRIAHEEALSTFDR
jgi:hypothetical protein